MTTSRLRLATETQGTVIDLLEGPVRVRGGWEDSTPGQGGTFTYEPYGAQWSFGNFQPVTETFDIAISGTGSDVIAALDRLQDFLELVRLFHAGDLAAESCWLEWHAYGEEEKRSLLYSGTFKVTSKGNLNPMVNDCKVLGKMTLVRHPLWENVTIWTTAAHREYPTPENINSATRIYTGNLSTLGGKYDYTDVTGNTLSRIASTFVYAEDDYNLYRGWIGLRPYNHGVANFNTVWECEDGTNGTDAADAADATASDGNRVTVSFATNTALVSRMTITVFQVAAANGHTDYDHFQGRYLVLCRCKVVGAGGVAGIQMRHGYTGNQIAEEVYVDNTAWRLIPLGNISIPPWEGFDYSSRMHLRYYRIDIYAEELVTCDLYLDCLVLIPNEHLLTFEDIPINKTTYYLRADTKADDSEVAMGLDMNTYEIYDAAEFSFTDWYLPQGDGCIVLAAEDSADHDLSETLRVNLCHNDRWTLYRGE